MSNLIMIMGESGTGKSTSIRNLPPEETMIINVLGKPFPFRGGNKMYVPLYDKGTKGNYFANDNYDRIIDCVNFINKERPDISNLIIDDFVYLMTTEFMDKALERGFDKFSVMANNAWKLLRVLAGLRNDLFVFVLTHSEVNADGKHKPKTIGKLLDEKICLEGLVTMVLQSIVHEGQFRFLTQNVGNTVAKSPMGLFDTKLIDNDLNFVKNAFKSYLNEDINQ